ncbi:MAG: hypothetical protein NUW06_06200 [Candidatus Acetothermia bacterium]|jgi:hypothetical protein|nr:hypothetical protein [Candidatus Acetothermia bacterium]MDH7505597.1 hypothetical protein [Candidatus Acetothermia bacterium]
MKICSVTLLLLLLSLLGLAARCDAAEPEEFAAVAALLEIGVGARPLGMGGAFTGLADDENAAFYNPAALAFLERRGLTSLYSRQFELLDYGALGLAGRGAGLNLLQLHSDGIERANEFGNPLGSGFAYISRAGIVSLGVALAEGLALGARLKLYQELSDGGSGLGWALDPALILVRERLRLGALLENGLSREIRFATGHAEGWPLSLRLGGSLSFAIWERTALNLLLDLSGVLTGRPQGHLGLELWVNSLGLRLGCDGTGISFGSSVWLERLRLDWALTAHPQLPDTQRLSLTLRF